MPFFIRKLTGLGNEMYSLIQKKEDLQNGRL